MRVVVAPIPRRAAARDDFIVSRRSSGSATLHGQTEPAHWHVGRRSDQRLAAAPVVSMPGVGGTDLMTMAGLS